MFKLFLNLGFCILLTTAIFAQNGRDLSHAALDLTKEQVIYDPSYFSIDYPNGDVPKGKGVCTDVIIRAYRKLDIDLQKEVHEDMRQNFSSYPNHWGLTSTDRNIDHRRVPNLRTYFKRKGDALTVTNDPRDYLPGDVVSWKLQNGMTHIGIVVDVKSEDGKRPLIVHNIGAGQVVEDCLFRYEITGHYRSFN
ncbi:DUF1287 domain-containing protein [Brumimicrobium aurantiacum]|uniref:DUF1287 domain-containing protein n=1 Tax=Brumimicrobium aurantiacum TaxID=1737063 RepID=A0A3E1EWH9_9FLAO|nr:DUF1287 domain-containing protein [Brumimicrobium aurantiacum]RFC53916.1 DUF1287 domain-containing protein [Brumimicrobium aurantiacum]